MGNYLSEESSDNLSVDMSPEQYDQYIKYLNKNRTMSDQISSNQSQIHTTPQNQMNYSQTGNQRGNQARKTNQSQNQQNQARQMARQQQNRARQTSQSQNQPRQMTQHQNQYRQSNQQQMYRKGNQPHHSRQIDQRHNQSRQPNQQNQQNQLRQRHAPQQNQVNPQHQINSQNQPSDMNHLNFNQNEKNIIINYDISLESIDPLNILSKEKLNINELLNKYKSLRRIYHPDRNNNNSDIFIKITEAVNILLKIKNKQTTKNTFNQLKNTFTNNMENEHKTQPVKFNRDKFTRTNFNQFFTENQFEDDVDIDGYGYMMDKSSNIRDDISVKKINVKKNQFNSVFLQKKQRTSNDIIKYTEPSAPNENNYDNYDNLGKKATNFTSYNPNISFTDYKDAYDESKMINEQQYNIKNRKYDEFKLNRENESLELTDEQQNVIKENKLLKQYNESNRMQNISNRRHKLNNYSENLNKLMLGSNNNQK